MAYQFSITRRVAWCDTDQAGIMHFSNFFRMMESAEHEFYRSLSLSVALESRHPGLGLPRVQAQCQFFRPLRFEDEVRIQLLVQKKSTRSLGYLFRFTNMSLDPDVEAARGSLTVVCVQRSPEGQMSAVAIPEDFAAPIEGAPSRLIETWLEARK